MAKIMTVFGMQIEESMLQPTIAEMLMKEHFTASVFEESLWKNHAFVEYGMRESQISFDYAIKRVVDRTLQMLRKEGNIAFNKEHREWMVLRKLRGKNGTGGLTAMNSKPKMEIIAEKIQKMCKAWLYCTNCPCHNKKIGCQLKVQYGFSKGAWYEN